MCAAALAAGKGDDESMQVRSAAAVASADDRVIIWHHAHFEISPFACFFFTPRTTRACSKTSKAAAGVVVVGPLF